MIEANFLPYEILHKYSSIVADWEIRLLLAKIKKLTNFEIGKGQGPLIDLNKPSFE